MQEVNSLCTDSRALRAEYCIVGIPHLVLTVVVVQPDLSSGAALSAETISKNAFDNTRTKMQRMTLVDA